MTIITYRIIHADGTIHGCSDDTTQPIYVGRNNPRFPYARNGYLLPSEPREEESILSRIPPEHKLYDRLQQAEGKLIHFQGKLNEHLDKRSKGAKYK